MEGHTKIIKTICEILSPKSYLELGIYHGDTIESLKNIVPYRVGVDVNQQINNLTCKLIIGTTKQFFNYNKEKFDIIFIDANHNYEFVKSDLEEAKKILNYNGLIILHDTDPESIDLLAEDRCSDSYKILDYINQDPTLTQITLPVTQAGITFVKFKNQSRLSTFLNTSELK